MIKPKEASDLDHLLLEKLDGQIHAVDDARMFLEAMRPELDIPATGEWLRKDQALVIAGATLGMLKHPSVNTTVASLMRLDPGMQALIADTALKLAEGGTGQQIFANRLRSLIEGRS